ncbi:DUF397 domain-containing protein [Streptomyces sp. SID12501]|uniref:DUF397 domain-containing protein n=1 Tax=Streptomyces sp. SID12501 TaxID=2706042 RepID=A0A6B3C372_9ACTN|nr:DUF397 domain-containing protein [Streptomyces sp. SID12501]
MTEVVGPFRKSSYSGQQGNCIEVAPTTVGGRTVRDSKDQTGPVLTFTPGGWHTFLAGAKSGELGRGMK